jgi:hypothetical protein
MAGRRDSNSQEAEALKKSTNDVEHVRFEPVEEAEHVEAFAISLKGERGAPKEEPILLVGTT